jgi:hypothetical protein
VRMVMSTPRDSVSLHVRPSFSPRGQVVWLRVDRPQLLVAPSPLKISGLGLETATITIGEPLSAGTWPIIVSTTQGRLDSTRVAVSADRPGVLALRSEGVGVAIVRARHPQFREGRADVVFVWPTGFLIAAVVGGLLGAIVGTAREQGKGKGTFGKFIGSTVIGLLTGLIVAVIYALGVNLTSVDIKVQFGEAVTFAIAALAAVFGPEILPGRKP